MIAEQVLWFAWIGVGAVTGWFAGMMMKTKYPRAILFDITVGAIGALLAAVLFKQLWTGGEIVSFNLWSLFVAFIGAVWVLSLMRLTTGRQVFSDSSQDNPEASAEQQ